MKLRSKLNPEEQPGLVEEPTRYPKGLNESELICGVCGGTYYVDDVTLRQAMSAIQKGLDNPFCCDDCEAELEELSH